MSKFSLTVKIPIDDTYDSVVEATKFASYNKAFFKSANPPHRVEYVIGPLSKEGVNNWKKKFRELMKNSKYKGMCSFSEKEILSNE